MFKIVKFFLITIILSYFAVWVSNSPGNVRIVWQEYLIETNVVGLSAVFFLILLSIILFFVLISKIKNKFLVVSQRRIPINKITFEFPGGAIDPGSNSKKAAMTELFEETVYKCNWKIKKLLTIFPEPGRLKCKYYC